MLVDQPRDLLIAFSLCEEILAFSHAFGSLAVRRVAL